MTDQSDNLVVEILRSIQAQLGEIRAEQREQRVGLAAIEQHVAHIERESAEFRAEIGGRFDRVHDRLDRIETRLGLIEV
ncbi:hypothetical protein [Inquilinus sp. Marseille-Q2685]|uniref:hypothetical protein n=1 Tax=Inquilinus sp. Marseille-Q2685 TaxID=2866581 RepID=UPI001CE402D2|nr:hypothetical protein [Inquilinus sp. Marseille-Q2685]